MAKNYHGVQINPSPTIVEQAGAEIADVRNRIMKYDENGNVVLATAGTDIPVGIALIEAGYIYIAKPPLYVCVLSTK